MSSETKAAAAKYHRRVLMEAADRLLVEHGYGGMNMNMLAKEAGYSKATVYVYFESKDEIVRLLAVERLKVVRAEIALILKNDMDAAEKFSEIKSVFDEFAREDGVYFDFVCDDLASGGGETESDVALRALVGGIIDDLTALAPKSELMDRWFAYYGRLKTQKIFECASGARSSAEAV
ncbi:MAG: TetR/AcrR family transcriptional regulator [Roseburia sp.]|nr:TetR/AcrR family transcriptional regulator [Roseburia sp.]